MAFLAFGSATTIFVLSFLAFWGSFIYIKLIWGSYPRVKAHLLHGGGQGVVGYTKTVDPLARREYQREQDEVDVTKRRHDELTQATPRAPSNIEPRIVVESRKRRASATQQRERPAPKNTIGASPSVQDSRIAKLVDMQAREKTDSKVARCIYACGIPFNVVLSPYWKDMIREINNAPQGYNRPNYERVRTQLLQNEDPVEDILSPIHSFWSSSRVTIISDGWTNTWHRPLINIISTSPKGAMVIKAKDCSREVKDAQLLVDVIIKAIEQIGPNKVVQVTTDIAPVCKAVGLIIKGRYDHIFWTPCIIHNLNLILEEMNNKFSWIKEITREEWEIFKFITNHH
eukprot:PITA_34430